MSDAPKPLISFEAFLVGASSAPNSARLEDNWIRLVADVHAATYSEAERLALYLGRCAMEIQSLAEANGMDPEAFLQNFNSESLVGLAQAAQGESTPLASDLPSLLLLLADWLQSDADPARAALAAPLRRMGNTLSAAIKSLPFRI